MQEFAFKMLEDETFAAVGYTGDETEVVIPDTHWGRPVTVLFDSLFAGHAEITSVRIPDTVTDIGEFVFDGCESLRYINLPEKLEHIWPYAFARSGIKEIILPDAVRSVAPFTFKDCRMLRKVVCGSGMKEIHGYAFGGCESLTELLFGPGTKLHPLAFEAKDTVLKSDGKRP